MNALDTDTIAAIATARGNGPVGIIRLSGPNALSVAQEITGSELVKRQAHYATFYSSSGKSFDSGLAIFFPGPNSFTGEDVVELQGHGGHVVLNMLLSRCLALGARSAREGEFSERAFLNGKIDLLQAEAIADLISAESETAAKLAGTSLAGAFSTLVNDLSDQLTELRALTEASIDFPEEDIDVLQRHSVIQRLQDCKTTISRLVNEVAASQRKTQGYTAALIGAPNAGKSSLLNALSYEDVAIVTHLPGTTRDALKQTINVGDVSLEIIDTAGIRDSADLIEQEGIKRAKRIAETADLVLYIIDDSETKTGVLPWQPTTANVITVRNKIDLSGRSHGVLNAEAPVPEIAVSAQTGDGLNELTQLIESKLLGNQRSASAFSARQRHVDALAQSERLLEKALSDYEHHGAAELLAEDLKNAQASLDSLTGRVSSDAILGKIFSTFCIGK